MLPSCPVCQYSQIQFVPPASKAFQKVTPYHLFGLLPPIWKSLFLCSAGIQPSLRQAQGVSSVSREVLANAVYKNFPFVVFLTPSWPALPSRHLVTRYFLFMHVFLHLDYEWSLPAPDKDLPEIGIKSSVSTLTALTFFPLVLLTVSCDRQSRILPVFKSTRYPNALFFSTHWPSFQVHLAAPPQSLTNPTYAINAFLLRPVN